MEKLLKDIDSDVASISKAHSWTVGLDASLNGLRGLTTFSGRALLFAGKTVARGVESFTILRRLRRIEEQLGREEGFVPPDVFEDLLEFQRCVTHELLLLSVIQQNSVELGFTRDTSGHELGTISLPSSRDVARSVWST